MQKGEIKKKIKNRLAQIEDFFANGMLNLYDGAIDRKICGESLVKYVKSENRDDENGVGSTGAQSTHYLSLKRIFSQVELSPKDSFIDVGCGKGRVLAFMIKKRYPCKISGVEINETAGKVAQRWAQKYDNVQVILGDAFKVNYNEYTVLFLGRPFLPETFAAFIEKLEENLTHSVKLIYWVDQQSGKMLKDREGWCLESRERIHRINGVRISRMPQGFSIWTYTPKN